MNDRDQSQIRAETAAGIKNVIQGLDGAGWTNACLKNPHITLPPGAGYLIVRHFQQVVLDAAENMAKITGFLLMPRRWAIAADAVEHITREWARDLHVRNAAQGPYERPFIDAVERPNHWRRVYELEPLMRPQDVGLDS